MKKIETLLSLGEDTFLPFFNEGAIFANMEEMFSPVEELSSLNPQRFQEYYGHSYFSISTTPQQQSITNNHYFETYNDTQIYHESDERSPRFSETKENADNISQIFTSPLYEQYFSMEELNRESFHYWEKESLRQSFWGQDTMDISKKDRRLFEDAERAALMTEEPIEKREVHIHNEIPSIRIEFSGSIDQSVDVDGLIRDMQRKIKEEMDAGTDFYYKA